MKKSLTIRLILVACIASVIWPPAQANQAFSSKLNIISYNVWFDMETADTRFPKIAKRLNTLNPDVILLQEVTPKFIEHYLASPLSQSHLLFSSPNAKHAYGLAYLTKKRLTYSKVVPLRSQYRRTVYFVLLELTNNQALVLANVHLESGQLEEKARSQQINAIHHTHLPEFINEVNDKLPGLNILGTLWAGDFNIDGAESHATLSQNWQDAARKPQQEELMTYDVKTNPLAKKTAGWFEGSSRLDRIYLNQDSLLLIDRYSVLDDLNKELNDLDKGAHALSDHYPIMIDLTLPTTR